MFGYVRAYQPELKGKELEQYRGVYCGLCKTLRRRYGRLASWTLHYDFVFLALFRMEQQPGCAGFRPLRCPYHPLRRRMCCRQNEALDFAADAAMVLVWYKLQDTKADAGFFGRLGARIALLLYRRCYRKACRRLPAFDALAADCMRQQARLEAERLPDTDRAADPTARMLAFLAAADSPEADRPARERLGYCLGRWIYLIDALADLEKDGRRGGYNPLLLKYPGKPLPEVRAAATASLNASLAECIDWKG